MYIYIYIYADLGVRHASARSDLQGVRKISTPRGHSGSTVASRALGFPKRVCECWEILHTRNSTSDNSSNTCHTSSTTHINIDINKSHRGLNRKKVLDEFGLQDSGLKAKVLGTALQKIINIYIYIYT